MVRIIILFFALFANLQATAQTETSNCKQAFEHYDKLLGENLIFVWETPPSIKKCSHKSINVLSDLVTKHTNYEYIIVSIIIDSTGTPICFKFEPKVDSEIKIMFEEKLKQLNFNPALQREKGVESIYTIKI